MRSKTLALVSTPRTSSLSTGPLAEPTNQPEPTEATDLAPHRRADPVRIQAAMPAPDAASSVPPPQWTTAELLGNADDATITHGDQVYRLRRTLTGKLILTK